MNRKMRNSNSDNLVTGIRWLLIVCAFFALTINGYTQFFGEPQFDKAEPEIEALPKYDDGIILLNFNLNENSHITDLKNNFFKIQLEQNDFIGIQDVIFPKGTPFGDEMVFKGQFSVTAFIKTLKPVSEPVKLKFTVSYQMCQEKPQEICFPPEEKKINVTVTQTFTEAQVEKQDISTSPAPSDQLKDLSSKSTGAVYKPKGENGPLLLLLALVLLILSFFTGLSKMIDEDETWGKFIKVIVVLVFLIGTFLFLKALDISYFPEKYSQKPKQVVSLQWQSDLQQAKTVASTENKHILIDSFADWCIACKELDEFTFSDPEVATVLKNYILVKLDFTKATTENKDLQSRLGIIGLPTVMLLSPQGEELRRFSGFYNKKDFLGFLKSGESWLERFIKLLKEELAKKSLLLFALVFFLGFLTSLTPCVYPVIPIVMGYIGTRSGQNKFKGFYLSIFFVLGLAFVYSILGVIAAMAGSMIGVTFQNPIVVIVISGIFIIMGLSLAGLFEIPVPSSISSKVQSSGSKSEVITSLIVGGVAGIIAAPCAGPVLVTLLSWISQTKDAVLGFLLTFIFSLGMGILFLVVGTFSGVISSLPKGGKWMDYIKYFFAVILMVGGVYILTTISSAWLSLLLWGALLISVSVFIGLFKPLEESGLKQKIYKFILVMVFLTGIFLFFKALEINYFTTSGTNTEIEQVK